MAAAIFASADAIACPIINGTFVKTEVVGDKRITVSAPIATRLIDGKTRYSLVKLSTEFFPAALAEIWRGAESSRDPSS